MKKLITLSMLFLSTFAHAWFSQISTFGHIGLARLNFFTPARQYISNSINQLDAALQINETLESNKQFCLQKFNMLIDAITFAKKRACEAKLIEITRKELSSKYETLQYYESGKFCNIIKKYHPESSDTELIAEKESRIKYTKDDIRDCKKELVILSDTSKNKKSPELTQKIESLKEYISILQEDLNKNDFNTGDFKNPAWNPIKKLQNAQTELALFQELQMLEAIPTRSKIIKE